MGNRPSRPWSLSRPVAPIEWTLIMRFCPQKELLRLARCSRTILSAASNPIAWAERPALVVDLAQLPRTFARSLAANLPLALHWTLLPSRQFLEWCKRQFPCAPDERIFRSAPPVASPEDVAVIRALPTLASLHVTGPCSLRERDWSVLWPSANQPGGVPHSVQPVQQITMVVQERPNIPEWRVFPNGDTAPLDHFPPSLLRYHRRGYHEETQFWRSSTDQPWIKLYTYLSKRWACIELYELQPRPDSDAPIKAVATVGYGFYQTHHADSLVATLRSRLSLDALMTHRGADELNGLRTMARCIAKAIMADPAFPHLKKRLHSDSCFPSHARDVFSLFVPV